MSISSDAPKTTDLTASASTQASQSGSTTESSSPSATPNRNLTNSLPLCSQLSAELVSCQFNSSCVYGEQSRVPCWPKNQSPCEGDDYFRLSNTSNTVTSLNRRQQQMHFREFTCMYCHQLDQKHFTCDVHGGECSQSGVARRYYTATCRADARVLCMGKRRFFRMKLCNKPSGKTYGATVTLSLLLGGLGADRFYLGMWREALGKLFTFGGLGVWSLLDFFLVAVGYICPQDDPSYGRDP
ncbi:TM2 domain-containing protein 3 [Sparganum proliferum]